MTQAPSSHQQSVEPWCLYIKARDMLEELECVVCEERDDTPDHLRPSLKQRLSHRNHCRGTFYRSETMNEAELVKLCCEVWPSVLDATPTGQQAGRFFKVADHRKFEVWGVWVGDELEDTWFKSILLPKRYTSNGKVLEYQPWREFQRGLRALVSFVETAYRPALPAIYLPGSGGRRLPMLGPAGTEAWFKSYRKENFPCES